jgi:hypothetical protein
MYRNTMLGPVESSEQLRRDEEGRADLDCLGLIAYERNVFPRGEIDFDHDAESEYRGRRTLIGAEEPSQAKPVDGSVPWVFLVGAGTIASLAILFG